MTKLNPKQFAAGVYIPGKRGDARKNKGQLVRRGIAMWMARQAGAEDLEIAQACRAGGWHMKTTSVGPRIAEINVAIQKGEIPRPSMEAAPEVDRFGLSDLMVKIDNAIEPIVRAHVEEIVAPYQDIEKSLKRIRDVVAKEGDVG